MAALRQIVSIGSGFESAHYLSMLGSQAATVLRYTCKTRPVASFTDHLNVPYLRRVDRLLLECARLSIPLSGLEGIPGDLTATVDRLQFLIFAHGDARFKLEGALALGDLPAEPPMSAPAVHLPVATQAELRETSLETDLLELATEAKPDAKAEISNGTAAPKMGAGGSSSAGLRPMYQAALLDSLSQMARAFFRSGLVLPCSARCCPPLAAAEVVACREAVLSYYNSVIHTIRALALEVWRLACL